MYEFCTRARFRPCHAFVRNGRTWPPKRRPELMSGYSAYEYLKIEIASATSSCTTAMVIWNVIFTESAVLQSFLDTTPS